MSAVSGMSEPVRGIFEKALAEAGTLTEEDRVRRDVEHYNGLDGDLNGDGSYDCNVCRNKGWIAVVEDGREALRECRCMKTRRSVWTMKRSGLENTIRKCRFDNFRTDEPWQKQMLDTAKAYTEEGMIKGAWFFIGGAVGSGKSHLCTAVVREALLKHVEAVYVSWTQESTRIKAAITEPDEYAGMVNRLKDAELLYIDDFFKPYQDMPPTAADVRLAYEILNHRYVNRKPTVISSERYLDEIEDTDEATGTRIYEMSRGYMLNITRDAARNQRKKETVMI